MAQPASNLEPPPTSAHRRPSLKVHQGAKTAPSAKVRRQPPELPEPGTRVVLRGVGLGGEVKPYDKQWCHGAFPVCFDHGRWAIMSSSDLYLEDVDP